MKKWGPQRPVRWMASALGQPAVSSSCAWWAPSRAPPPSQRCACGSGFAGVVVEAVESEVAGVVVEAVEVVEVAGVVEVVEVETDEAKRQPLPC